MRCRFATSYLKDSLPFWLIRKQATPVWDLNHTTFQAASCAPSVLPVTKVLEIYWRWPRGAIGVMTKEATLAVRQTLRDASPFVMACPLCQTGRRHWQGHRPNTLLAAWTTRSEW